MKIRKDHNSPWGVRAYFDLPEFEGMMEEALFSAGSDAFKEGTGVEVDLVLLKAYALEADYVTLPAGIMGRTFFSRDGTARVEVSRELVEDAEADRLARRRLRTTLAHEGGHVACHRQLFVADTETLPLFGEEADYEESPAILCREPALNGYRGEWWEYQANQCMASLLLPKRLLIPRVYRVLRDLGISDFSEALARQMDEDFLRRVADLFDVSWQAALFRLQALGFIPGAEDLRQGRVAF